MIFRNSLLSILRSKGKTALFALLIVAITLALALSVSVWASVAQFLEDCDDFYSTIGLFEYMGTGYPNDTTYDAGMDNAVKSFNAAAVIEDGATLIWEAPARSLGYIEGFWRTDTYVPSRMQSVLVVGRVVHDEEKHVYNAVINEVLYSVKGEVNNIILIDENFGSFESDRLYLVFGEIYRGHSPILHLRRTTFDNATAAKSGAVVPHMIDITSNTAGGRRYAIPEDSVLVQVAETLAVTNNSVLVSGTNDLMSLLPFHQQELYITDGRAFTEDEYANGSRVAVLSNLMAARLGLSVGDTIDLSAAVSDQPGVYSSYWVADGFSFSAPFTVVGLTNTVMDKSWYVFVPRASGVPWSQSPIGYTIGHAVLRNQDAAAFSTRMESLTGERFQFTVYDQGYSTVAIPYQTILRVAKIVTAVCVFVELAVLILFGFLFVYRQQETSETMRMLGTSKAQVCRYFLYGAGAISLAAAAAGAVAGYWLHDSIIAAVAKAADRFALIDSRYSNGNLTISRTLEFAPQLEWQLFFWVGAAVFLFAVLASMAFTVGTFLRARPSRQKIQGPKKEHQTSRLRGGSLKFAILSMRRGGVRSLVVPALAVSVVIFLGQLATVSARYQSQLDAVQNNTTIEGYYTDINGKQIGNLVLDAYDVANLYRAGLISSLSASISEPYYYLGISQSAGGMEYDLEPLFVPDNGFAYESLEAEILRGANLTATNNIRTSPEFYYADTILMNFIEGYDETILAVPTSDEKVLSCILPTSLMAEKGISLGDTVRVAFNWVYTNPDYNRRLFRHIDLRVVGSYEKQGTEDTIYAPLSLFFNSDLIWDEGQATTTAPSKAFGSGYSLSDEQVNLLQRTVFHSANFTLADSRQLVAFKEYLAGYGYSQVNNVSRVRKFIVLKDAAFNNAVASIRQQIRYVNTLYPFLYALIGVIALVVSYLLIVSRKKEFATMRGLGTTRAGSFFSFFHEQSILCLVGTAAGLAAWRLFWNQPTPLHLALTAGFLTCYFIGCTVSIMIMNHTNVLAILLDKD